MLLLQCVTDALEFISKGIPDYLISPPSEAASSEEDWDVREQEGLREVEKILDKANQILAVRSITLEPTVVMTSLKCQI